jgi:hypothetical protein
MKKLLINICFASSLLMAGCTKDFDSINIDPTKASPASFDANYFLSTSQWTYVDGIMGYNGSILFQSGWSQVISSTSSGGANYYSNADKYAPSSNTNDYAGRAWERGFRSAGFASEILKITEGDAALVNLHSTAMIMKILAMQYVTDIYGDIPYSQAFKGSEGVSLPVYDKQQDVYNSMLTELEAAILKFDATKAIPSADIFNYKGNVAQWKKFGYSLMLRIAMRMTKVDAAKAKLYAEKAATGGTFAGIADNAYVLPNNANGYTNQNSRALRTVEDFYSVRWSKKLIDYLSANNDPRLGIIAEVPQAGLAANNNIGLAGDNNPAVQLGQPVGYDLNGGATDITKAPGYPGGTGTAADATPIGKYSRPRSSVYLDFNTPVFVLTYAETELLLAEAAARGWSVGSTAAAHYKNGVSAALQTLATFNAATATISAATADAYATAHPLDVSTLSNSLKMINEQYWVTTGSLMNFTEAWNNWKRSGYPELTPVNYTGNFSTGLIPRRQPYPTSEATTNAANYKLAVNGLTGGDNWVARTWWDK